MGYFLSKLAAKSDENERTVGGTARGALTGIGGAALGGAALGGGIYGGAKGIGALTGWRAKKLEEAINNPEKVKKWSADKLEKKKKALTKWQERAGKTGKWPAGLKEMAKKHWKWGVPVALGAGALGGGLLLND